MPGGMKGWVIAGIGFTLGVLVAQLGVGTAARALR